MRIRELHQKRQQVESWLHTTPITRRRDKLLISISSIPDSSGFLGGLGESTAAISIFNALKGSLPIPHAMILGVGDFQRDMEDHFRQRTSRVGGNEAGFQQLRRHVHDQAELGRCFIDHIKNPENVEISLRATLPPQNRFVHTTSMLGSIVRESVRAAKAHAESRQENPLAAYNEALVDGLAIRAATMALKNPRVKFVVLNGKLSNILLSTDRQHILSGEVSKLRSIADIITLGVSCDTQTAVRRVMSRQRNKGEIVRSDTQTRKALVERFAIDRDMYEYAYPGIGEYSHDLVLNHTMLVWDNTDDQTSDEMLRRAKIISDLVS